jgi:hypothetical protein
MNLTTALFLVLPSAADGIPQYHLGFPKCLLGHCLKSVATVGLAGVEFSFPKGAPIGKTFRWIFVFAERRVCPVYHPLNTTFEIACARGSLRWASLHGHGNKLVKSRTEDRRKSVSRSSKATRAGSLLG